MRPEPQPDGTWLVLVEPAWPGFAGHFPGDPILPAAVMTDWALAVLDQPVALVRAKFIAPLRPGDVARLTRTGLKIEIGRGDVAVAVLQFIAAPGPG
jgi:3-hydroxymyristoyl/3-hydroxydecanoyl-(acyl carrier protein) dehydratase